MCEDDRCLTIFVPISYLKNFDGAQESETEKCVVENLNELNKSASDTIQIIFWMLLKKKVLLNTMH